ncbi:MAG: cytochrome c [Acidimicrobiia bacterium]|nr:cytochrome c [Acidimicrobiia bacterium]
MHLRLAVFAFGLVTLGALATPAAQNPRTQWDAVYTAAQAEAGAALYGKHCGYCHGEDLLGGGFGSALAGPDFWANWDGKAAVELVDRIRNTMPQDSPGTLSRAQSTEIVTYILQKNDAPAGKTALEAQPAALKLVTLRKTK